MKVSFGAVLIGVRDILKSKPFYENVFDVVFDEVRPPFSSFSLNGIEFQIEENTPNRGEKVREQGGTHTEVVEHPWGYREAHFTDLDGNDFIVEQEIG